MCFATAKGAKDSSKIGIGMMHLTGVRSAACAVPMSGSVMAVMAAWERRVRRVSVTMPIALRTQLHLRQPLGRACPGHPRLKRPVQAKEDEVPGTSRARSRLFGRGLAGFVEHLLRRHRHDLGVGRDEMAALDQLHEFRLDLARHVLPDAAMLVDVAPFTDQVEMVGVV